MTEPDLKLTPATPDDLADSLSFALRFEGRKSKHDSERLNADIVARRLWLIGTRKISPQLVESQYAQ
jgi:hypothetical protein